MTLHYVTSYLVERVDLAFQIRSVLIGHEKNIIVCVLIYENKSLIISPAF